MILYICYHYTVTLYHFPFSSYKEEPLCKFSYYIYWLVQNNIGVSCHCTVLYCQKTPMCYMQKKHTRLALARTDYKFICLFLLLNSIFTSWSKSLCYHDNLSFLSFHYLIYHFLASISQISCVVPTCHTLYPLKFSS